MYIARRDFFLSWEASSVYTFLTIAMSDRIFAGSRPQSVELAQKIAGRCSQSGPEPAVPTGKSQTKLSTVALWEATSGAIKIGAANRLGWGSSYPRGSGSLTPPPRADSLTFKNLRSETGCAGLGQTCSSRKDVSRGRRWTPPAVCSIRPAAA